MDHGLLLQKLHKIVIRGRLLKSIQYYLNGRSSRIRIQGCFSDEKPVSSGFFQGSIVASLLCIIYINDLPDLCRSVFLLLCTDDAKFIAANKPKSAVQIDSSRVKKWSDYLGHWILKNVTTYPFLIKTLIIDSESHPSCKARNGRQRPRHDLGGYDQNYRGQRSCKTMTSTSPEPRVLRQYPRINRLTRTNT